MHYLSGNEASAANDNPRTDRPINPIFLKEKGVEIAVHYTQEQIDRANAVDILDYARSQGLEMKREGKDWRVKNYPGGFMITPEKNTWNWFVESKGGGVVQLCMFLEDKTWPEAIGTLLNEDMTPIRHAPDWKPAKEPPKEFILPERNDTNKHVYAYLTKTRGLDADIVKNMLDNGYIYENKYRSCVFVGRDTEGVPRHASVRSTNTSGNTYKKDVSGSQKKYSFSVPGTSGVLNVFEAPIDALSYMSMQKQAGKLLEDSYLALGGVSDKALARYLADFPDIQRIRICTDGDEAGDRAAGNMMNTYGKDYAMERIRPVHKDFNEDLLASQVENIEKPENLLINSLTGKLISSELAGVLSRLNQDIYVPLEEILDTPEIRLAESIISDATPTEKIEHREELQAHVLEQLAEIGSAVIDSNGNVAYNGNVAKGKRLDIIVGLPASGKSSVFADTISQIYQSRLIDSDEAKKLIPEYNDGWGSSVVHEESKNISARHLEQCRWDGENIVLPKVGGDMEKMRELVTQFKASGYQVYCHYVDLSREKTLARMITRFLTDGRYLRPVLIDKYNNRQDGNKIEAVYEALKKGEMLNGYSKWSNDVRQGEQPVLIENECGGEFYERITETYSGIDRGYGGAGRYSGGPDQSGNQRNRIENLGQTGFSNRNENSRSDIQGSQIYPRKTGRNGSAAMGRLEFGNQGGLSEQDIYGGGYGTREEQYGGTGRNGAREIDNNATENLPEKSFAARVDDVLAGKADRYNDIKVCDTPEILLEAGCRQLPVFYTQKHLRDALRQKKPEENRIHYHGLTLEQIKKIPDLLREPVIVYDSLSRTDSIVVVTAETDQNNNPIVAVLRPEGKAKYEMELVDSNFMLSVYGREHFDNQIKKALKEDKILYWNKTKSQELFSVLVLPLLQGFNNLDFDKIIHPSRNIVNQKFAEAGEERSQTMEQEKIRKEPVENDFNTAYTRFLVDILGPEGEKTAQDDIATDSTEHMKQRLDKMIDIIGSEDSAYITREVETTIESLKRQLDQMEEKSFAEQVDEVLEGKGNQYNALKVCDTPPILLEVGCRQLPMLYTQQHLRDALKTKSSGNSHWHGLTVEQIKEIPNLLENPAIVLDSLSHGKTGDKAILAVLNAFDNDKAPLIVSIVPNGTGIYNLEMVESNFITSVYGKDNGFVNYIEKAIKSDNVLYWNKIKSQELFMFQGLQLPEAFNNLDSDVIIHPSRNIVNQKFAEAGEKRSQTMEQAQKTLESESMPEEIAQEAVAAKEEMQPEQLEEENFPVPDSDAEPVVTILWSEHSRFHDGETMSLSEANAVMERLDETTAKEDGYYKTKFRIDFVMGGQPNNYIGRQDLGDGDGTLINHIEKYYAYYENNAEWDNYILRNKGKEALEEDKAQRQMLLHEFVPYLKLHENLSKMERTAAQALQEKETMTSTETAYYAAIKEYVSQCRNMVNSGEYDLPPAPQIKDFDTELEAYKEHVKEEIAQEAATAGMTVEEYAANGYEPLSDPSISIKDVSEEDKKTYVEAEYDNYLQIVSKDGNSLKDVPKEYYTEELLMEAVKNWGAAIKYIPENLLTQELALASVRQYGLNLRNIPPQLRSEEVCIAAYISSGGRAISYVPKDSREKVKQEALKQMSVDNEIYSENQLKVAQLQQQGQEWANQIENILKEHEDNPAAIVEDIAFAAKFYNYSIKNIQIMHMQNPYITYVASASAYEKMGYHVKPGEQALAARVPLLSKYVLNEKKEPIYANQYTEEIKQKVKQGLLKEQQRVTGFRFVSAFYDISQTDCPVEDYPSIYQVGIPSARHQEAFEAMKEFAESIGFQVNVTDLQSIALRGDCDPVHKIIRINDKLESTVALSTLCHEIAHGIIHTSNDRKKTTEAQRECEADVMDVMLESSMGLPISPNRTEHLYANFHKYKNEQAAKERPYDVTLEKLIDRVQTKVFRPYAEEIKRFLEQHLPEKGYDAEAREIVNDLAMLASAYDRDYLNLIDSSNPLFASKVEDYREQYMRAKEKIRLDNSFVPKLAIWKYIGEPAAQQMYEVQLPDARTIELIKEHPDELTPSAFPYNVEEGDLLSLKQNVLEDSDFYKVCQSGLINITNAMDLTDTYAEQKINAGFDCLKEYQCLDRLLKKDIPIEKVLTKHYEYLKAALGKQLLEPVTDTDLLESGKKEAYVRVLSSTSDQVPADRVYSIYDFKSCMDKACASETAFPAVMYKLVTKQGNEIQSYIDTYKENTGQSVYEQLYSKVQNENPELSRIISRQYYQDQADFAFMDSNERLQEEIKRLDLAPADAELLKLNAGNIQAEQLSSIGQMNQQMQQRPQQKQQMEQTI